jgi:hypothetical protein
MTAMVKARSVSRAPSPAPLVGTLLDAATVTEGVDWLDPEGLYPSFNCLRTGSEADFPCPETYLSAPVLASAAASAGGTLAAGTYRYVVTAINGRGETVASNEVSGTTATTNLTLNPTWAAVTGATGYRVYRSAIGGAAGSEHLLATVGAVLTYADNGSATPGSQVPPTANTAVTVVSKTFSAMSWVDGLRFAVYGGVTCKAVGFDQADAEAQLRAAFLRQESNGVEQAVMKNIFTGAGDFDPATDLTPSGGAVDPATGLALLEGYAAQQYAGVPTVHAPRSVGSLLWACQALDKVGSGYVSKQGSKVASGGGYYPNVGPTGAAPSAGELWMYASGEVMVERGSLIAPPAQLDRSNNEVYLLTERLYVASVDCFTAAVRVTVA